MNQDRAAFSALLQRMALASCAFAAMFITGCSEPQYRGSRQDALRHYEVVPPSGNTVAMDLIISTNRNESGMIDIPVTGFLLDKDTPAVVTMGAATGILGPGERLAGYVLYVNEGASFRAIRWPLIRPPRFVAHETLTPSVLRGL
jgi:hypothetical protein